jgi:hypothetical protein
MSIAEISGPGLAGVLVQLITAPLAIMVDAASFLVASVSLALISTPEPRSARPITMRNLWLIFSPVLRLRTMAQVLDDLSHQDQSLQVSLYNSLQDESRDI